MVDGGTQATTYPDPAECSSTRSRTRRGRVSRGGRGRGSASTSAAASTSASTSQTAPSTSSAPASRGRGGRGGRRVVQQTFRQSVNGVGWFSQTLSQTFQAPKPQKKGTSATY
ncbi:hypothetical protein MKW98_017532 [Papaver atlanticum]|uniref:Uncharacterized protein n=1 Tax=Papaver atlanticum TaxID=357466 RepID=A0AAD4XW32_9MAGN|nr:hypothetical protein MKW98_017532 [Papaver atlanticum]